MNSTVTRTRFPFPHHERSYFTYDSINATDNNPGLYATFGPIEMEADGVYSTPLASIASNETSSYGVTQVKRKTTYTFNAGGWAYQLTDDAGETYWMQSYSTQLYPFNTTLLQDPEAVTELMTGLPQGWTYEAFIIPEDAQLLADGTAFVVTDQFMNTYQRTNEPFVKP